MEELSNRRIFELWNGGVGGVVESANRGVVESSNGEMVQFVELSSRRSGEMVELVEWSTHRIVECWNRNGGVGGVVESSNGGMVELMKWSNQRIVELSSRRMV